MITVTLRRRVRSREEDRVFVREAELPCLPPPGSYVRLGQKNRRALVSELEFTVGSEAVVVVLKPDDEGYRGADWGRLLAKYVALGFRESPDE